MASSINYKLPPALGPETSYESWKSEVAIWRLVSEVDKKKQALAMVLSLTGKAREKALQIEVTELNKDTGVDTLIASLDTIFLKDKTDLAYSAYTKFDSFRKPESMSMADYIIEFERNYDQSKKHDMVLLDAVLSFKLLDSANLSCSQRQLALTAASDLNFENMKKALRRIFADSHLNSEGSIEVQSAYYTSYKKKNKDRGKIPMNSSSKLNPVDKHGKVTRCAICQSIYHWKRDCPDKKEDVNLTDTQSSDEAEECHITLFTKSSEICEIFTVEARGAAILDTACSKTVCGKPWLDNFMASLTDHDRRSILSVNSNKMFKFGDGKVVQSTRLITIPARIGNVDCYIQTEVVPTDIPLLLSKTSLQRAGTILNLKEDKAEMLNQNLNLESTSSGHYCVSILKNYEQFNVGDTVYFKKINSNVWNGPATVFKQDDKVVFVKYNGSCIRVHSSRLCKMKYLAVENSDCHVLQNTGTQKPVEKMSDFEVVKNKPDEQDSDIYSAGQNNRSVVFQTKMPSQSPSEGECLKRDVENVLFVNEVSLTHDEVPDKESCQLSCVIPRTHRGHLTKPPGVTPKRSQKVASCEGAMKYDPFSFSSYAYGMYLEVELNHIKQIIRNIDNQTQKMTLSDT